MAGSVLGRRLTAAYLLLISIIFDFGHAQNVQLDSCEQHSAPVGRSTYWDDVKHCSECVVNPNCGFCFPALACRSGTSEGPSVGPCKYWVFGERLCPVLPTCDNYVDCKGCLEHRGCTWSYGENRCQASSTSEQSITTVGECSKLSKAPISSDLQSAVDILADTLIRSLTYQAYVDHVEEDFLPGHTWPMHAISMAGSFAMWNVVDIYKRVREAGIAGDFVETGVWKGANGILFAKLRNALGEQAMRRVYCLDSFEWLPKARAEHKADRNDKHHGHAMRFPVLRADVEAVTNIYRRFGLDVTDGNENIEFVKGWFQDTAPKVAEKVQSIAILRLDGDMYGSTWEVLVSMYHKVSIGGYIIIDDYHIPGCRMATDHFRTCVGTTSPLQFFIPANNTERQHPYSKTYWVKEKAVPAMEERPACYQLIPPDIVTQ